MCLEMRHVRSIVYDRIRHAKYLTHGRIVQPELRLELEFGLEFHWISVVKGTVSDCNADDLVHMFFV